MLFSELDKVCNERLNFTRLILQWKGTTTMGQTTPSPLNLRLRNTTTDDLPQLFEYQADPEANYMAAFTSKNPTDRDAYITRWTRLLAEQTIPMQTILVDEQVVGSVGAYVDEEDHLEVTYWIGKPHWGKGIAT